MGCHGDDPPGHLLQRNDMTQRKHLQRRKKSTKDEKWAALEILPEAPFSASKAAKAWCSRGWSQGIVGGGGEKSGGGSSSVDGERRWRQW